MKEYGVLKFKQRVLDKKGNSTINVFKNAQVGDIIMFQLSLRNAYMLVQNTRTLEQHGQSIKIMKRSIDTIEWEEV